MIDFPRDVLACSPFNLELLGYSHDLEAGCHKTMNIKYLRLVLYCVFLPYFPNKLIFPSFGKFRLVLPDMFSASTSIGKRLLLHWNLISSEFQWDGHYRYRSRI